MIYLTKNEVKQVSGGIGNKEKSLIVAGATALGAITCGPKGVVAGHRVGEAAVGVIKAFSRKKN